MTETCSKGEILLADDDPVVRHLVSKMLTSAGYGVETVESGAKCLAFIEQRLAMNSLPAALLLDLQLLDMSGVDVLVTIRKLTTDTKGIKIIMLSANNRDEVLALQPAAAAADDFLEKPFTPDKLTSALSAVL